MNEVSAAPRRQSTEDKREKEERTDVFHEVHKILGRKDFVVSDEGAFSDEVHRDASHVVRRSHDVLDGAHARGARHAPHEELSLQHRRPVLVAACCLLLLLHD